MSGHDHLHGPAPDADARRLATALALIVGLMAAEVVVGVLAHSLALLSDAAHMLTDAGALVLSLVVIRLVARPSGRGNLTFGLKRAEILSAQANGFTLLVLSGLIVYGAVVRLVSPPRPGGLAMLVVALAGVVVNLAATWQLAQANRASLNVEGSFRHILTDLAAFALTAVAGAVVLATGFGRADGMSVEEIGNALVSHPHVASVHDLHVWEIGSGFPALSAHVLVHSGDDCHVIRRELELMLEQRFEIEHSTLQVDHERARRLLTISLARGRRS